MVIVAAAMDTKGKRRKLCSSSADCWWYIPKDLIPQILLRLPVKSLLRFKSVCKSWNSIISNPSFAKTQFHHSARQHLLSSHLIVHKHNSGDEHVLNTKNIYYTMSTLHLDLTDLHKPLIGKSVPITPYDLKQFYVAGSCNGLVCMFHGTHGLYDHSGRGDNMYVWNPTINKTRIIPLTSFVSPYWLPMLFGFGYASSIDDYRIVLVVHYTSSEYYATTTKLVHVYSFRHDAWSVTDIDKYSYSILLRSPGFRRPVMVRETVVIKDALLWNIEQLYENIILKFDMVNESFDEAAVFQNKKRKHVQQFKIGGVGYNNNDNNLLCVCHIYNQTYCCRQFCLPNRVMDDQHCDSNNWQETKFEIQVKNNRHRLLRIMGNGKVVIFAKKKHELNNLLIYDARTQGQRSKEGLLVEVRNEEYCTTNNVVQLLNYVPSLISPDSI